MSAIGTLVARIATLAVASIATVLALAFGPGPYDHPLAMLVTKRELLAQTPSPKLLLLGGSGILNGVDSRMLATALGVRVVNLGVYAGCGSEYAAEYIGQYVNEGDAVVLIPEYAQFLHGLSLHDATCRRWMARALFPRIPQSLYAHPRDLLTDVSELALSKLRGIAKALFLDRAHGSATDGASFLRQFNEYGDSLTGFAAAATLTGRVQLAYDPAKLDVSVATVRKLAGEVERRKASFRMVPQAAAASWFSDERERIVQLVQKVDSRRWLGRPEDQVFDDALFQDTVNHLGPVGRWLRTDRLLSLLRSDGVFHTRYGQASTFDHRVFPARYDLVSGFHEDRLWTRGDAVFHRLAYARAPHVRHLVVEARGWAPYRNDPARLKLRAFVDGVALAFVRQEGNAYWFELPPGADTIQEVRIVSSVFRPVDLGINDDSRSLGLDVASIAFR